MPRLPRRSGAASRASRRRLNPAAICPTPATQNDGRCEVVPRLPRETTVDVRLCHACHVKSRWMSPSATPATQKWRGVTGVTAAPKPGPRAPPRAICPTPATQTDGRCEVVPRLPREIKVDVTKCVTGVTAAPKPGPRAPPRAICPTPATQNDGRCEVVPRLPREIKVDVTKCHACHAEVARRHGRHGGA